ncbi:MAG: oxygenase MpaB family protein [Actinomycetota bacterium]
MITQLYADEIHRQADDNPTIYGDVDFDVLPERFDREATVDDERFEPIRRRVARVIDDPALMDLVRNYTMKGDRVADAYAALIPEYGFRELVDMLERAWADGVEAVPDAPAELAAFIGSMELTPDWVDMELVERGAAAERIPMATATPFAIRGAFLATFLNKYAALPMTMTGTLSDEAAAKRVFETASFFTATTLPGALRRNGRGFLAAAKVRLMHSMVRFHLMQSGEWDVATYGIPIPQIDQMPAGQIGVYFLSSDALTNGQTEFTDEQRAVVELSRYRCFLLGLPAELLGETPQEVVDLMTARHVSLREGFDDEICGSLVRGALAAELFDRSTMRGRLHSWLEGGFSRLILTKQFLGGDEELAQSVGIDFDTNHKVAAGCAAAAVAATTAFYRIGPKVPYAADYVDARLNRKLARLLDSYGHADFVTDPDRYRLSSP